MGSMMRGLNITLRSIPGRRTRKVYYIFSKCAHLLSVDVLVAYPLADFWPPILEDVSLGVLDALAVAESTLRSSGGDHVHAVKVDLQPLARLRRDLILGAPCTAVDFLVQPVCGAKKKKINIYFWIIPFFFYYRRYFFPRKTIPVYRVPADQNAIVCCAPCG